MHLNQLLTVLPARFVLLCDADQLKEMAKDQM